MDKKVERVLDLYSRVSAGEVLHKAEEARRYGVNQRTIQRDLDDLRAYLASQPEEGRELVYDRKKRGYILAGDAEERLTNSEILAVCKILLESRSMVKEEMYPIIDKLLRACTPREEYRQVQALIGNEKLHYLEPHHGRKFVDALWDIGGAVYEHRLMRIRYRKLKEPDRVMRLIQPVGIMFSEYYFYLCAYICAGEDAPDQVRHSFPTIYRIDRIAEFQVLREHFHIPYADRFQEGEFRKRIQFMFGGELRTVKFKYTGLSIEAVLDRFPTAEILSHDQQGWVISAQVYGDGVDMWLRGQGSAIELLDSGRPPANRE